MTIADLVIYILAMLLFFGFVLYSKEKSDKEFEEDFKRTVESIEPFDPANFEVAIMRENKSGEGYYRIQITDKYSEELKQRGGNINKH